MIGSTHFHSLLTRVLGCGAVELLANLRDHVRMSQIPVQGGRGLSPEGEGRKAKGGGKEATVRCQMREAITTALEKVVVQVVNKRERQTLAYNSMIYRVCTRIYI